MIDWRDRWKEKRHTDCDDLPSAILRIVDHNPEATAEEVDEALMAIRPLSGWRQEREFDPTKPTARYRPYGRGFYTALGEPDEH